MILFKSDREDFMTRGSLIPVWFDLFLGEFYFRWFEKNVIEIDKATVIPFIFNHLKWNLFWLNADRKP